MYSILIVDDESIILEGLKEVIADSALPFKEIRTASLAAEALRLYEKSPFDIVLTDISMPQMNGLQMAEAMGHIWSHSVVIFLTGYRDFCYVKDALRLHSFDYLLKPMPDEELLDRLQAAIEILDNRWMNQFMYDCDEIFQTGRKNRELSKVLKQQMRQGKTDFESLKMSGFPFDRERKLRLLVFGYQTEQSRVGSEALHDWIAEILQKITYGYGYICGFSPSEGHSVFLIQKLADGESLFAGVYKALEEMQGYFYTKLDLRMTIAVSRKSMWENWIELAGRMLIEMKESGQYGSLYTFEECSVTEDMDGNLLMYRIRDYIIRNPGEDLSLGRLAQQFHINPSYLSRSFHQTIQKPLSHYTTQVRMDEAKRLLRETDDKIYEIAGKVGFDTQGYFTKVFNKMVGISPKEYRSSLQK
jgi:two-component system response regulator YesN